MNEHAKPDSEFERLRDIVSEAFPDLTCLRCKGEDFYLDPFLSTATGGTMMDGGTFSQKSVDHKLRLVCQRCGFIEEHALQPLLDAQKPIVGGNDE